MELEIQLIYSLELFLLHDSFLPVSSKNPAGHTSSPDYKIDVSKQVKNILCDCVNFIIARSKFWKG